MKKDARKNDLLLNQPSGYKRSERELGGFFVGVQTPWLHPILG